MRARTPRAVASLRARALAIVAALAVAAGALTLGTVTAPSEPAEAAVASAFDPGNIISDANFYNGSALDANGVQAFLTSVGSSCRAKSGGPACLKDFRQNVSAIAAVSGRCNGIGGGMKSAATIIAQVGAACGISQKALLVLMQKEQGIVATSSPTSYMYLHATGFACPDTAPCDPAYFGFAQQVYAAALQFKRYQANPTLWAYRPGRTNTILYNPNGACGTKQVYIQNSATAGLYIYTPYTPNQAAMANLYGSGDACSAYGNRNFWRVYSDWFGSPNGGFSPVGSLDSVVPGPDGKIKTTGWAADRSSSKPLQVAFYVDGKLNRTVTAHAARPDLAGTLGAGNTDRGWSISLTGVGSGTHAVCAYAVGPNGQNALLRCVDATMPTGAPYGSLDQATGGAGTIATSGWLIDPDTSSPAQYKLQVDSRGVNDALPADGTRSDVAAAHPGYGSDVGFSHTITGVAAGKHTVALWGQDVPGTRWVKIAERTTTVSAAAPTLPTSGSHGATGRTGTVIGAFESVTGGVGTIDVRGWAIDPDVWDPVRYRVDIDGRAQAPATADAKRTDIQADHPGWGSDVGVAQRLTGIAAGKHTVALSVRERPQGTWVTLGTKSVTVQSAVNHAPYGSVDTVTGGEGTVSVTGWGIDADGTAPLRYDVRIDGVKASTGTADRSRTDVAAVHPSAGSDVGFSTTLTGIAAGKHTVTVLLQNVPGGKWTALPDRSVTVRAVNHAPFGSFDSAVGGTGTVAVSGWGVDQDGTAPLRYDVRLDGEKVTTGVANGRRDDVAAAYPASGSDVGFATTLRGVAPGKHTVTVLLQNLPDGSWQSLGDRTVTVVAAGSSSGAANRAPVGVLEAATGGSGSVTVSGWGLDQDGTAPLRYDVRVDGQKVASGVADRRRDDVAKAYPSRGADVGFSTTLTGIAPGKHTVTVLLQNLPSGSWAGLGDRTVTVS